MRSSPATALHDVLPQASRRGRPGGNLEDNVQAARRWIEDMHALCQQLDEMPSMGVAKSSIRPGLRMLPAGSYLILYQQVDKGVEIARVLHGARQWQDLL
jgi:toxin ParE1/3/4